MYSLMIYPQNFSLEGTIFFVVVYKIFNMPSRMEEEKLGDWM